MNKHEEKMAEINRICKQRFEKPWSLAQKPFKVIENIYFVGNTWVSAYLLDTSKGLVLVDCAYEENLYLLIDSIRALGFDPHNIKHLLISHGHFDHCGAAAQLQAMSNCEIWISENDAYFFTERRDLIAFEERVLPFRIDHYFDYKNSMDFGNIVIRPVLCAGHTPGTTTFFFDFMYNGRKLIAAMHGGLGTNTLDRESLKENGWPLRYQQDYLNMLQEMKKMHVDVLIPSHAGHAKTYPFFEIAAHDDGTGEGFINTNVWREMLEGKEKDMLRLLKEEAGDDSCPS